MGQSYEPVNEEYKDFVRAQFSTAGFIQHLGIELLDFGPGWCETRMKVGVEHHQQDGFFHAGVVATVADHSAGMASGTLCDSDKKVLTVEYKINLLRPGRGKALRCRAEVVRPGRTLTNVESRVYALNGEDEKLIATMSATMALV